MKLLKAGSKVHFGSNRQGFTLIEVLLAIVIIATLGIALMLGFSRRIASINYQFEGERYLDLLEEYESAAGSGAVESEAVEQQTGGGKCGYSGASSTPVPTCTWLGYFLHFDVSADGSVTTINVRPVFGKTEQTGVAPNNRALTLHEYDPYIPTDSAGNLVNLREVEFDDMALQVYTQHQVPRNPRPVAYVAHPNSEDYEPPASQLRYLRGIGFTNINLNSSVLETGPDFQGSVTSNKGNIFVILSRRHNNGNLGQSLNRPPELNLMHGSDVSGRYCMNSENFDNSVRFAYGRADSVTSIEQSVASRSTGESLCVR